MRPKDSSHDVAGVLPHAEKHALAFMVACPVFMGPPEVAEPDRPINSADNFGQGDVCWIAGENVAPADATLRPHESSTLQCKEDLFQVRLGECGASRDIARTLGTEIVGMKGEREEGSTGIISSCRHPHGDQI